MIEHDCLILLWRCQNVPKSLKIFVYINNVTQEVSSRIDLDSGKPKNNCIDSHLCIFTSVGEYIQSVILTVARKEKKN